MGPGGSAKTGDKMEAKWCPEHETRGTKMDKGKDLSGTEGRKEGNAIFPPRCHIIYAIWLCQLVGSMRERRQMVMMRSSLVMEGRYRSTLCSEISSSPHMGRVLSRRVLLILGDPVPFNQEAFEEGKKKERKKSRD